MSDPTSPPLKPQDTLILLLGELKGETRAIREGQAASQTQQAERDAENKREHEEFRKQLGDHQEALAVLKDNKQTASTGRAEFWTRVGIFVAVLGVITTAILTIIWH